MSKLPPKRDVMLALLETSSVYIHLDPRDEGVRVPPGLKGQPQLVLQVGLNMAVPIMDLDVGETGVSGTLSFSRRPYYCVFPWHSVFALVSEDGRGMVWPKDIPPEVAASSTPRAQAGGPRVEPKSSPPVAAKPKLRAVPGGLSDEAVPPKADNPAAAVVEALSDSSNASDEASSGATPAESERSSKLPTRGHLRRVK